MWVFDARTNKMEFREINWIPGLFKIYGKYIRSLNSKTCYLAQMRFWLTLRTIIKETRL